MQDHPSLASHPPLPEEGPPVAKAASDPKAPEAIKSRGGDVGKHSLEGTNSMQSPPHAESGDQDGGKKRKRQEDLVSLGTSKSKDVPQG
jgi:hypothetical protein